MGLGRREFFKILIRDGVFGVLGFLCISLIGRSDRLTSNANCPSETHCQSCGQLSQCQAPRAKSEKVHLKESTIQEVSHGPSF